MIVLTRLNGEEFTLNAHLIETMEEKPDTVMRLTNEKTLIVQEKITEIISRVVAYNRSIYLEQRRTE